MRQSGEVTNLAWLLRATQTTLPIIKAAPFLPSAFGLHWRRLHLPHSPPPAETVDVARILKRKLASDRYVAVRPAMCRYQEKKQFMLASPPFPQAIQGSVDSYRRGGGIDTMTTSGVGCKRRSLSPSSLPPSSAASLPNSFGLVANQVADTAIVRRGGFLPLFPRSCSKPETSSGSMLPQRSPSRPKR